MGLIQNKYGMLKYEERDFESSCFKRNCFEIIYFDGPRFEDSFAEMRQKAKLVGGDFVWVRLPISDIDRIRQATSAGFYFVETTIIPFAIMRAWDPEKYSRYLAQLEPVNSESLPDVELIAKHTFSGLRFNLDKEFGDNLASERYRKWFQNAYNANEDIRVLRYKDRVVGFSLLRHGSDGITIFRLAGIHPDYKQSGLGLTLYASTTAYCKALGAKRVDGGISAGNLAVLNTMSAVGYSFKEPSVVLHYIEGA